MMKTQVFRTESRMYGTSNDASFCGLYVYRIGYNSIIFNCEYGLLPTGNDIYKQLAGIHKYNKSTNK